MDFGHQIKKLGGDKNLNMTCSEQFDQFIYNLRAYLLFLML